jgi:hypothetical protein
MTDCYWEPCPELATVEAIGTLDAWGIIETVVLRLCDRHAATLDDEIVILETVPST